MGLYYLRVWANHSINVGDEGGFAPATTKSTSESVLSYISDAVDECGYSLGRDIPIGIDCAATSFWDSYVSLCDIYPIRIIEDPFREDDSEPFAKITAEIGSKTCIVGDDIFVTNKTRVCEGIELGVANSIIIKVNQVGALTGAMEAVRTASYAGWGIIASHRSGETNDDWLSDFSVGMGADAIKAGAPARRQRISKYNRLMNIEQTGGSFCSTSSQLVFKSNTLLRKLSS